MATPSKSTKSLQVNYIQPCQSIYDLTFAQLHPNQLTATSWKCTGFPSAKELRVDSKGAGNSATSTQRGCHHGQSSSSSTAYFALRLTGYWTRRTGDLLTCWPTGGTMSGWGMREATLTPTSTSSWRRRTRPSGNSRMLKEKYEFWWLTTCMLEPRATFFMWLTPFRFCLRLSSWIIPRPASTTAHFKNGVFI